jgi:hypothetical protein
MDEPVLAAPAILLEILWNHLKQQCFSERNIQIFQRCEDFPRLQLRSHQISYVHEFVLHAQSGIEQEDAALLMDNHPNHLNSPVTWWMFLAGPSGGS